MESKKGYLGTFGGKELLLGAKKVNWASCWGSSVDE